VAGNISLRFKIRHLRMRAPTYSWSLCLKIRKSGSRKVTSPGKLVFISEKVNPFFVRLELQMILNRLSSILVTFVSSLLLVPFLRLFDVDHHLAIHS